MREPQHTQLNVSSNRDHLRKQTASDIDKDLRVGVTTRIWFFSTIMLAVSMPFARGIGGAVLIPLAIIIGTTVSTAAVWGVLSQLFTQQQTKPPVTPVHADDKVKELEERLANVEIISVYERSRMEQNERQNLRSDRVEAISTAM
jgi:hypothetical protein